MFTCVSLSTAERTYAAGRFSAPKRRGKRLSASVQVQPDLPQTHRAGEGYKFNPQLHGKLTWRSCVTVCGEFGFLVNRLLIIRVAKFSRAQVYLDKTVLRSAWRTR